MSAYTHTVEHLMVRASRVERLRRSACRFHCLHTSTDMPWTNPSLCVAVCPLTGTNIAECDFDGGDCCPCTCEVNEQQRVLLQYDRQLSSTQGKQASCCVCAADYKHISTAVSVYSVENAQRRKVGTQCIRQSKSLKFHRVPHHISRSVVTSLNSNGNATIMRVSIGVISNLNSADRRTILVVYGVNSWRDWKNLTARHRQYRSVHGILQ